MIGVRLPTAQAVGEPAERFADGLAEETALASVATEAEQAAEGVDR